MKVAPIFSTYSTKGEKSIINKSFNRSQFDGEGDASEGEANFASKKASKHFRTTIYITFHLMNLKAVNCFDQESNK